MEGCLTFFIKLTIIFVGGGLVSLLAYWVFNETSSLMQLILSSCFEKIQKGMIAVIKSEKASSHSGIYEIFLHSNKTVKVFSSHKGMKVV